MFANFRRRLKIAAMPAAACLAFAACGTATPSDSTVGLGTDAGDDASLGSDDVGADTGPVNKLDQAKVYLNDPKTDNLTTTLVTLAHPTDPDGHLAGDFAAVSNCLQQDGGAPLKYNGFQAGSMCVETPTVTRDEDQSYLSILPPADDSEAEDKFAELMMYYHVNQIHDFYQDGFDLALTHNPIDALVNVTFNSTFDMGGGSGWQGFPNAAFMPPEAFAAYGLPKKKYGAIVFGQYQATDFSYDASVIYHEYTHAMVGTTRLSGVLVDSYGLDNLPGAMNEGFADYFSCSKRDSSIIGPYALTFQGDFYVRDLSQARKCPDDLTSEVHADGKIIGSTLWEIRGALGQQQADEIILNALQGFTSSTNLAGAGKLILAEAKKVDAATGTTVSNILKAHGVINSQRAKDWAQFSVQTSVEQVPIAISGTDQVPTGSGLDDGVPGYFQFVIKDIPAGTTGVTLAWRAQAGQGGLMGGGGGSPDVQLAVRKDSMVMVGQNQTLADAIVPGKANPAYAKGFVTATLTGACLPASGGKLYVMLLNKGSSGNVTDTDIKFLTDTSKAVNVVTCPVKP
jgi:hypothetical protein